jgi:hypothetical protein
MTRAQRLALLCLLPCLPVVLLLAGISFTQASFQDERPGSVTVSAASVAEPSSLSAQTGGSTVELTWSAATASTAPITYDVCRSTTADCPVEDSIGTTADLQLTDSSPPTADGSYYYGVRATAAGWFSGLSNVVLCLVTAGVIDCP